MQFIYLITDQSVIIFTLNEVRLVRKLGHDIRQVLKYFMEHSFNRDTY